MTDDSYGVRVLHPPDTSLTKQKVPMYIGISSATASAEGISMNLTEFPPGASSEAHFHHGFETAIYAISGRVVLFFGPRLEQELIIGAGDFLFIPPEVPHKAFNLSASEPAVFVTARNDAHEQENVILTPKLDDPRLEARARGLRD